jgi:hypothetical protein
MAAAAIDLAWVRIGAPSHERLGRFDHNTTFVETQDISW